MAVQVWDANSAPVFCTLRTRKCCEVFWCAYDTQLWLVMMAGLVAYQQPS